MNDQQQAVAAEPRLFIGQCGDATADQLADLFGPFAARGLRALQMLRKGCAMVLYERWAEAEAAQEAHNGRTRLNGGRPLVVTFANPKRLRQGESPEPAIAPRKLFIGQVPKDATEGDLRPLFEPFGEIVGINVLRTQRGQGPSAGCAFVEYRKWSQAECAMETHNGVTKLAGSEMPLVVKFADAKRGEQSNGSSSGINLNGSGHLSSSPKNPHSNAGWDYNQMPVSYGVPMPHGYGGAMMHSYPYGGYDMGGGIPHHMYSPAAQYSPPPLSPYGPNPGAPRHRSNRQHGMYNAAETLQPGIAVPRQGGISRGPALSNGVKAGNGPNPASCTPMNTIGNNSLSAVNADLAVTEGGGLSTLGSLATNQLMVMQAVAASGQPSLSMLPAGHMAAIDPIVANASIPLPQLTGSSGGLKGLGTLSSNASAPLLHTATAHLSRAIPNVQSSNDVATAAVAAADLLSSTAQSLGVLSLSDQANLAGTTAGLQAVGLSTTSASCVASLADTSTQLAALNAEATHALEAALAGRQSTLSADAAAGLLAAQQVLHQAEHEDLAGGGGGRGGTGLSQLSALEGTPTATAASGDAVVAAANAAAANALSCATGTALVDSLGASAAGLAAGYLGSLTAQSDASTGAITSELSQSIGAAMPGAATLSGTQATAAEQQQWGGGGGSGGTAERPLCNLDHASQHFKLFVGQVPMEASEQELWTLFSPIGEILELYMLRNNQTGRSRGCAFVTFSSRTLAQKAITQLNGRQVGRGTQRQLVVKFADRVPT